MYHECNVLGTFVYTTNEVPSASKSQQFSSAPCLGEPLSSFNVCHKNAVFRDGSTSDHPATGDFDDLKVCFHGYGAGAVPGRKSLQHFYLKSNKNTNNFMHITSEYNAIGERDKGKSQRN